MDNFVNHEPISRFLICRLKYSPTKVFLLFALINVTLEIIPGLIVEWSVIPKNYMPLSKDYTNLFLLLVIIPSSWAFFTWLPFIVQRNLLSLCKSGVVSTKDQPTFKKIVNEVIGITGTKRYKGVSVIATIAITGLAQFTASQYTPPGWPLVVPLYNYIILVPKMALSFYIFIQYLLWTILLVFLLTKIFNSISINLIPYHSDNACGLEAVGEFSYGIGRIALVLGLFIVLEIFNAITRSKGLIQPNIILEIIAFPVVTGALFFLPLVTCRMRMVKAKEEILQRISDKIQDTMERISNKDKHSEHDFKEFNDLVTYRKRLQDDIHTWPISAQLFRRFGFRLLLSSVPGILSTIIELTGILKTI